MSKCGEWVFFAGSALTRDHTSARDAASLADGTLKEFDIRWTLKESAGKQYWKQATYHNTTRNTQPKKD